MSGFSLLLSSQHFPDILVWGLHHARLILLYGSVFHLHLTHETCVVPVMFMSHKVVLAPHLLSKSVEVIMKIDYKQHLLHTVPSGWLQGWYRKVLSKLFWKERKKEDAEVFG